MNLARIIPSLLAPVAILAAYLCETAQLSARTEDETVLLSAFVVSDTRIPPPPVVIIDIAPDFTVGISVSGGGSGFGSTPPASQAGSLGNPGCLQITDSGSDGQGGEVYSLQLNVPSVGYGGTYVQIVQTTWTFSDGSTATESITETRAIPVGDTSFNNDFSTGDDNCSYLPGMPSPSYTPNSQGQASPIVSTTVTVVATYVPNQPGQKQPLSPTAGGGQDGFTWNNGGLPAADLDVIGQQSNNSGDVLGTFNSPEYDNNGWIVARGADQTLLSQGSQFIQRTIETDASGNVVNKGLSNNSTNGC